ncbi:MAG: toprim domain-containing protein [Magnetococcales bacterium]|nr:toprim domain-containing protein [Magnetococcales bacterium]
MDEPNGRGAGDPHGERLTRKNCTSFGGRGQGRYAEAALNSACNAIINGAGGRNVTLNKEAFGLGQLVGGGLLDRAEAEQRLTDAAQQAGLDPAEIRATLRSGLEKGIASPREIDMGRDTRTRSAARPAPTRQAPPADDQRARERLIATWRESVPLGHPGAEGARRYLIARGLGAILIDMPGADVMRFHPALPYFEGGVEIGRFPAMIGLVQDVTGQAVSLLRIFLTPNGFKADVPSAKKLMTPIRPGATKGAAIRLIPVSGPVLGICEGVETGLAIRLATGMAVWSAISASGLAALELPPEIRELFIWCDLDSNGVGQQAAEDLARRMVRAGRIARILTPPGPIPEGGKGRDWLDEFVAMRRAA